MPSSDDQQRGSFLRQTLRGDFTFKSRRKTLHPVRAFFAMHVWLGLFHLNALIVFALLISLNDRPSIRNGLIAVYAIVCVFPNKKPYPKWGLRVANHIVHAAQQYFPLRNKHIEEEKHLKLVANGTPVLIGLEPHGVLPLQMAAIADYYLFDGAIRTARDHACFKNEGERQRLRDAFAVSSAFASSSIFYVPLVRHLWPWLGLDPISRYHVKKVLSNGGVAVLVPGGVSEVLKMENTNLKAYFRRGQGHFQLKNLDLAWKDLKRAVKLSPEDEIVRGELEKCEEEMEKAGMVVEIKCPEFDAFEKEMGEEDGAFEEIGEERLTSGTAAATSANDAGFNSQMPPGGMSPDLMQQAAEMMKDMSPETMETMMSMAAGMQGGGVGPDGMPTPDTMKQMQQKMGDPKMQKAMAEMMSKVNPEQIKQMSKAAGMNMSDEQAEHAAKTLKNVKPETMEKFMKVAAFGSKFYGRFKTQIDWMNRNRKLTLAIAVVVFATFVQQVIRWWRRRKGADDEASGNAQWSSHSV